MWRKNTSAGHLDKDESVQDLARRLGVERRANVRVLYPKRTTGPLPAISCEGRSLHAHDLSVGGCCVHDPAEILGSSVGHPVTLTLHFTDAVLDVKCRLVGRVDHRRHIQFLDLPAERGAQIRRAIQAGVLGQRLSRGLSAGPSGPALDAKEIWTAISGDNLVIGNDSHEIARICYAGRTVRIRKHAWPTGPDGRAVSMTEMLDLVLFMANVRAPSPELFQLRDELESTLIEASL